MLNLLQQHFYKSIPLLASVVFPLMDDVLECFVISINNSTFQKTTWQTITHFVNAKILIDSWNTKGFFCEVLFGQLPFFECMHSAFTLLCSANSVSIKLLPKRKRPTN